MFADCDLAVSAGDLPIRYYDYIMTVLGKDFYYVYGNHNLEHFDQVMRRGGFDPVVEYSRTGKHMMMPAFGGNLIDGKIMRDKRTGLIIMGLGGSMLYNYGKSQYTERQMSRRLWRAGWAARRAGGVDIVLTHAPPRGCGDLEDAAHRGFEAFFPFLERYQPQYLIHGHIHMNYARNIPRRLQHGKTTIINAWERYELEI